MSEKKAKRASSDPLKNEGASKRYSWYKTTPDRWKEVAKMDWGTDRSMASELETVIKDADTSQWPSFEKKLLKVLATINCSAASREFVCRMFRLIGSPACVPALTPMLFDPKLADQARYALETIPGTKVDAVLNAALGRLKGDAKIGLAGTIAARKQFEI